MKRILSLLCVFCLLAPLSVPAFAAKTCACGHDPVIFVPGFGKALYADTDSVPQQIYKPSGETFGKQNIRILFAALALLTGQHRLFADLGMQAANGILGTIACDNSGNPAPNTGVYPAPLPTEDVHGQMREDVGDYMFVYDWRLSPVDNAEKLHEYVQHIRTLTEHDNVSLVCHSMGGTILAAYLYLYGSEHISHMVCLTAAWQGLSIMGSLLCGEADIHDKAQELDLFLQSIPGITDIRLQRLIRFAGKSGLYKPILRHLQRTLDSQFDRVFYSCLRGIFGTMPGMWAFVPDSYYERAKAFTFSDDEHFAALIEKIDFYHYRIQNRLPQILETAMRGGMQLVIVSGYGISTLPLSYQHTVQSDFLIDTVYTSIGAVSMPFDKALPASHRQAVSDGHNHISPDRIIDASTCAFPEQTWFVRGMLHFRFPFDAGSFVKWAVAQTVQPTVQADAQWPQYIHWDGNVFSPLQ